MDTPIITQYYKEHDPMKRKELLEQSIAARESVPRRIRSVRNYGRSVMQSHPK